MEGRPRVSDLIEAIESIAPPSLAEPWDRVGLQVGSGERDLSGPVMLTIDFTDAVLSEALSISASAVIAYHPPIWEPLRTLTDRSPVERRILRAAEAGIAIYAPHTSLDATSGGVTDWLGRCLSEDGATMPGDCRALTPASMHDASREMKVVTFVPSDKVEDVRHALASAGAGIIGAYTVCSFSVEGTGTFLPGEDTNPTVGSRGELNSVSELRLEMVCSKRALALALETLRQFHPYEEPAVDVYELIPQPSRAQGGGRRLVLDQPATVEELGQRLMAHLGGHRVKVAHSGQESAKISRIGIIPGSGGSMIDAAVREGCELLVTGELSHHEVLRATHLGLSLILAGHSNTERGYLRLLAQRLRELVPGVRFVLSSADVDPLRRL